MKKVIYLLVAVLMFSACNSKKNEYDPYKINGKEKKVDSKSSFEVSFKKTDANLKTIHVKLNNNGYDALFDTGCSGMLISSLELMELIKTNTTSKQLSKAGLNVTFQLRLSQSLTDTFHQKSFQHMTSDLKFLKQDVVL